MSTDQYKCPECGEGHVALRAVAGRKNVVFPGVEVELPADLVLPTCDKCFEWNFYEEHEEALKRATEEGLLAWQRKYVPEMVEHLREREQVTRQRIAAALGVTPSHLSHVAAGTSAASATVLRLLYAFVADERMFRHVLEGRPLEEIARWHGNHDDFSLVFFDSGWEESVDISVEDLVTVADALVVELKRSSSFTVVSRSSDTRKPWRPRHPHDVGSYEEAS